MKITYAGCDWLTLTSKDEKVGQRWYQIYRTYKQDKIAGGDTEKPFSNGWYSGVRTASMSVGQSDQIGYMLVLSGSEAEMLWPKLTPAKHRVTRLDLCFDFRFDEPVDLAENLWLALTNAGINKQRKFSKFVSNDGGGTLYMGSRQSTQYGRIYDKGVQSKMHKPGLVWRAEVEYKKPMSGSIAKALSEISSADRALTISDTVAEWYALRGAELFKRGEIHNAMQISVEARITTADRKLAWLRTQVAPTIKVLVEAGYGAKVLECLFPDLSHIEHSLPRAH